jgi:hypothetical protein
MERDRGRPIAEENCWGVRFRGMLCHCHTSTMPWRVRHDGASDGKRYLMMRL